MTRNTEGLGKKKCILGSLCEMCVSHEMPAVANRRLIKY